MIEEDIEYLQDQVDNLHKMITNVIKAVRPGHSSDCFVIKNKDNISKISFTEDEGGNKWYCYCKNKKKHSAKCLPHLSRILKTQCNCGYKEVQIALGMDPWDNEFI